MNQPSKRPRLPVTVLSGFLGAGKATLMNHIAESWDPVYGDRRQEIVFIGTDMDEAAIRRRLDACLVGDANVKAMHPAAWKGLKDPFPVWKRAELS